MTDNTHGLNEQETTIPLHTEETAIAMLASHNIKHNNKAANRTKHGNSAPKLADTLSQKENTTKDLLLLDGK